MKRSFIKLVNKENDYTEKDSRNEENYPIIFKILMHDDGIK